MTSRTYQVGRSSISLIFGDLTQSRAEALVSSDNCFLSMGGGVSEALRQAAGLAYRDAARKVVRIAERRGRLPGVGDVVVPKPARSPRATCCTPSRSLPGCRAPETPPSGRRASG